MDYCATTAVIDIIAMTACVSTTAIPTTATTGTSTPISIHPPAPPLPPPLPPPLLVVLPSVTFPLLWLAVYVNGVAQY